MHLHLSENGDTLGLTDAKSTVMVASIMSIPLTGMSAPSRRVPAHVHRRPTLIQPSGPCPLPEGAGGVAGSENQQQ